MSIVHLVILHISVFYEFPVPLVVRGCVVLGPELFHLPQVQRPTFLKASGKAFEAVRAVSERCHGGGPGFRPLALAGRDERDGSLDDHPGIQSGNQNSYVQFLEVPEHAELVATSEQRQRYFASVC